MCFSDLGNSHARGSSTSASQASCASTSSGSGNSRRDDSLREFRKLCAAVASEPSYTGKTALIKKIFDSGPKGRKSFVFFSFSFFFPS